MDSINVGGELYYQELELDQYGFNSKEKDVICEFYDYYQTKQAEKSYSSLIIPMSKEHFNELMPHMENYLPDVCLLWEDENSNYAGVYYKGLLRGKVMFLCHEELWDTPLFRDISSFVQSVKNELTTCMLNPFLTDSSYNCDYPAKSLLESEQEQNLILAKKYLENICGTDDDVDFQSALKAFYLMPAENLNLLIPLMKSANMYIEQDIPNIFVYHNYRDAIPNLREAAESGSIHIQSSAKRALLKFAE